MRSSEENLPGRAEENAISVGEIGDMLPRLLEEHDFSGTALVRIGKQSVSMQRGEAHRGFHVPVNGRTRFDCASVTKLFTAAAALQLVGQGRFALDTPICDLADLAGTKIPRDVTVLHLLNHTSGIADDADEEAGEDYADLFKASPNYAIRECRDFLPNFAYKEPNFAVGTDVRYCNCSFVLLGLAIEKASGLAYREYVRQNIFVPAGMHGADFLAMDGVNENFAEGYTDGGTRKNIYSYPPIGTPDGGACVTAQDLCLFFDAVKGGRLLPSDLSAFFLRPNSPVSRPFDWNGTECTWRTGCALEFVEKDGKIRYMYKEGVNAGVSAIVSYHPEQDALIALLSNNEANVWTIHDALRDRIHR